ncbi:outer membrane protein domain-containing protein [Desulfarculus baarsii DSM 2075]|uniref:Outer membrane protein domain-containing protein n=1 Tax=Desulfarculus baarsii (strain ATCC 33931 / DSM 2075 / LMG 7858 / VKM B-1802 / 2st14) TaxID=644282 RepID=E1QGI8_DESB2|nr:hypothetical protein [Desulfarculus baarsii]ADK84681.1 outer membrane protein domain-containing protein [Desulfarculus baarsii DSM 2075]
MFKVIKAVASILALWIMTVAPALADSPVAVTAKVGTLGLQADVTANFNEFIKGRLSLGALPFNHDISVDSVNYDFDIKLYTAGLLLDVHPFANSFRLSGGVIINSHDFSGSASPSADKTYNIGGTTYTGAQLGRMDADASFNKLAPYAGLGFSNAFTDDGHFGFAFDLGVMWWGSPDISLSATHQNLVPGLSDSLRKEEGKIEDDLNNFKFYPVASVGLSYSF